MLLAILVAAACEAGAFDVDPVAVVESITLDITDAELVSGRSLVIEADLRDAGGNAVAAGAGARIEWSTSDAQIASITPLGEKTARVTGYAAGTAEITAEVNQTVLQAAFLALLQGPPPGKGPKATSSIHVRPANLVYVAGSGQSGTAGTTLPEELVVQAIDDSSNGVPNVEITFVTGGSTGTLEPTTVVTAQDGRARSRWTLGSQTGTVTAEATAHNKFKLPTITFTATSSPGEGGSTEPASIEVAPRSATLNAVGDTLHLAAVVRDSDGKELAGSRVSWSSKNSGIATVDTAGRVVAVKAGRAPIVASIASLLDSAVVDVDQHPASVTVSPGTATLGTGESRQFTATVEDSNGVALSDPSLQWSSSNTAVATVDANGVVTAKETGSATLTAATDGVSGTASLTVQTASTSGDIPAFPGAEGWGATALNACRDKPLRVHFVTNTNSTGPGSFYDVVMNQTSASTFDVVVFRTGGNINAGAILTPGQAQSCLYLAGQTAPGDGVAYQYTASSATLVNIGVGGTAPSDMVWRYLRFWSRGNGTTEIKNFLIRGGTRLVFDHLSVHFTDDSWLVTQPMYQSLRHGTFQNSMTCSSASTGIEFVGNAAYLPNDLEGWSLHHHYACHGRHRMPRVTASNADTMQGLTTHRLRDLEIINLLTYKRYGSRTSEFNTGQVDLVNNLLRHEGAPESGKSYFRWERNSVCDNPDAMRPAPSVYMSGNRNATGTLRQDWGMVWSYCGDPIPSSIRRSSRLSQPEFPVSVHAAGDLPNALLPHVGASRLLACDGTWRNARDPLDAGFVADWWNGTGPTDGNDVTDTPAGWYPTLSRGTACADVDSDGLPDAWEQRFFGSATGANPAAVTASGYLVIEHYLNGTDPRS